MISLEVQLLLKKLGSANETDTPALKIPLMK